MNKVDQTEWIGLGNGLHKSQSINQSKERLLDYSWDPG